MNILVIAEHRQGKWNNTSFETLAAHVSDDKQTPVVVDAMNVEEVAANRHVSRCRNVCGADTQIGADIPAAEKRALQRVSDNALALERCLRARANHVSDDR